MLDACVDHMTINLYLFICLCMGSPVRAVGLTLRAINEVKLDRARWVRGWVTRLTLNWTLVVGWPAAFLACACSVNIVDSLQYVQLIGCGDQRAGVQTVRQNIKELSVTKTLCCHWRMFKGYVWHWYNTIFKTIAGVCCSDTPKLVSVS